MWQRNRLLVAKFHTIEIYRFGVYKMHQITSVHLEFTGAYAIWLLNDG